MPDEPTQDQTQSTPEKGGQVSATEAHSAETAEDEESPKHARPLKILLAVGIGLFLTICMLIFVISDRMNSFDGADRIVDLLDSATNLTGDEFEPVDATAGELEDWFFLKHGLEHYAVPKQFANIKTIGCRVFKFNGATVAQVMAVGDKQMLFYLFPSDDLGIKVKSGKWEIVEGDSWVGGVTGMKDTCFLVSFHGTKDEMSAFLEKH